MEVKRVTIFTDGSCYRNDRGRSGYGAVLQFENETKEIFGGFTHSTNNRAEISAAIIALESLEGCYEVTLYSDSKYVTDPLNKEWLFNWIRKDFKGVKNPDLWKRLIPLIVKHKVTMIWVKGHNNGACPGNERADELAEQGASLPNLKKDNRFT